MSPGDVSRLLTRRQWLGGLGATLTLMALPGHAADPRPTRFVYLTDIHSLPEWRCPDALALVGEHVNSLKPEFILVGGDIIDGGFRSTAEAMEPHWNVAMPFLKSLKAPLFTAAGNHDLVGAQKPDFSPGVADPRKIFREKFNLKQAYQSYDIAGHHIVILDSVQPVAGNKWGYEGRIPPEQMDWLREDLAKVKPATPIILVTHMPILTGYFFATGIREANGAPSPSLYLVNGREVLSLFANHNLRLVLQGHLHVDETLHWQNITFITGGAVCGKKWAGANFGTKEGYGQIQMNPAAVDWTYSDFGWKAQRPSA